MMDKKEILNSGLLERYLLDEVSEMERLQVEKYLQDAEIRQHFQQLEISFEKMALENAIPPPAHLKNSLLGTLGERMETPSSPENKRTNLKPYLAIAATLAFLFGVTSFWLYTQLNGIEDQLDLVRSQNEVLTEDLENLVENYDAVNNEYDITSNPSAQKLIMVGNNNSPDAIAISYVNHTDKTVYLNAEGLPDLPDDHDYQLWADVEGEMIDMGVITKGERFLAMNYIDQAESLNITIEPAGGSDHPTVERLITNVYLQ
ncbi:MAG: anti-sigma factor [Flavobacteriaceae bacterium]|nr:anti-sigma factor [Flavobacteriaceae bacterium]